MPKIFISYRRDDSQIIAHRIYDALAEAFGKDSVFIDVDKIMPGADFRDFLNREISNSDVVLILIADRWAEIMRQRLRNPDDFVRIELVSALEQRKRIIPILLGDARMPNPQDLPERVRAVFPYLNAKSVGLTRHFHRDMEELIPLLRDWESIVPPRPLPEFEKPRRRFPRTPLLLFSLIMLLLVFAVLAYPSLSAMLAPRQQTPSASPTEVATENLNRTEAVQESTESPTENPSPTPSPTTEASPTPRGGGNVLVFSRSSDNSNVGKEIFGINISRGLLSTGQLTNDAYDDDTPEWSPDGSQIVYESFRNNAWVIVIINADGSEAFQLTGNGFNSVHPHWSPDGDAITFARGTNGSREIYIQGLGENLARQVTNLEMDAFWPVWHSDEMIYFITDNPGNNWINRMNMESGEVEALASLGGNVTQLDISPDGSQFVYAMDSNAGSSFVPDIYVMDSTSFETRNITAALRVSETFDVHYNYPSWSPDSSQIVFMTSRDHNNEIYIMNAEGSQLQRITNTTLWEWTSSWRP